MQKFLIATVATLTIGLTGAQAAMRVAPLPPIRDTPVTDVVMAQAGTLSCMVQGGVGYIVGSSRVATCTFDHPGDNNFSESYVAKLSRVGVDVGVMPKQAMRWAVYTPGGGAEPGMLMGAHPGSSTEANVGVGDGGKVSFQSNGRNIVFEQMKAPMAFGVSFGVGEATLELSAPTLAAAQ
jgi:hypothetical protein